MLRSLRPLPLLAALAASAAAPAADAPPPAIDLREFSRQRAELLLEQVAPPVPAALRDRAAREFLAHLRKTSPLTAERVERGELDDAELRARLEVFVGERPELRGATPAGRDAAARVAAALARTPGAPGEDAERRRLAAAFLERLAERQHSAAAALAGGTMTENELESRLAVFLADRRADAAAATDERRAALALAAFTDRFVAANFGPAHERVRTLAVRGTVEEGGRTRDFVLFRRHPDQVRLHYLEAGYVALAVGSDGTRAWRQPAGERAVFLAGADARAVRQLAEFDHPLIDAAARGTVVRLAAGDLAGTAPVELEIVRADGETLRSVIDPMTLDERLARRAAADGRVVETRFADYRAVGPLRLPHRQEAWIDGKRTRTVTITQVETESGLLAEFFARPDGGRFAFMDFQGALEVLQKRQAAAAAKPAAAPSPKTGGGS